MSDQMGLRQKVKKGIVSIDEAINLAENYNENIQRWLQRRKDAGVKVPSGKSAAKRVCPFMNTVAKNVGIRSLNGRRWMTEKCRVGIHARNVIKKIV